MADFIWQDLIDRAKVYVDEDHEEEGGWIKPDKWMVLAQVEYSALRRRWLRMSLVGPAPVDQTFTGPTYTIPASVTAIVGVAEVQSDSTPYRLLTPAQSFWGSSPFWGQISGTAVTWSASGPASSITITLDPADSDHTYVVRYIPGYTYATDPAATISVPDGWDERLVLGIAKRAHIKDSVRQSSIEDLIKEAEADISFSAFGRVHGDGPRVRRLNRRTTRSNRFTGGSDAFDSAFEWVFVG